ncbi:MAG: HmuY family protein [Myxococcales bacterium]|nr:HmuY family protein [Polyangiaceae bacterium]MDW8252189.1 HmuY family protein [Myxococcales bacterium]
MRKYTAFLGFFLLVAACSSDTDEATSDGVANQTAAGSGGSSNGSGGLGAGNGGSDGGSTGSGGSSAGAGGASSGSGGSGQAGSGGEPPCTEALASLLGHVDKVSEGQVLVVKEEGGVRTLYVDASAGGQQAAPENPRVYVELAYGKRVDVTDPQASKSDAWDLALKRALIFTNSGDGGPGGGGAVFLPGKTFEQVTSANTEELSEEAFVSEDCIPHLDQTQTVQTTFTGWYIYNEATHKLSPTPGVFVVRGSKGALYKIEILSYYGEPDGSTDGMSGGRYLLRIAGL